ncbi:hypothetical protein FRC04_008754 [Tulasnella sp. 424]|nr:hypothetical protein FRC04_008754 [Tulasnella sp. 424]KAG8979984.1 hypothetical protein FRC05_007427 [Tulasnella sp. 425]
MSSPTTAGVPCPNCLTGYILPGEPSGKMVKAVSSLPEAYLASKHTKPSDGGRKKAIVLFTDIFGLPLVNCKIMADAFNERVGVDVYVPDLFQGKPPIKMEQLAPYTKDLPGEKLTWTEIFWFVLRLLSILPGFLSNRPSIGDKRGEAFVRGLKEEKEYTDIGAVGYCYGGHMSTYLAATDLIKTSIITHPGGLNAPMVEAIKVPTLWQIPEEDEAMPEKFKKQTEAILKRKEPLAYEFTEYKGTRHGFAARPNLGIPQIKQAYEDALDEAVEWFKKTL